MAQTHKVEQGDCLSSIARKYGFADMNTIWNDPQNKALKAKRENLDILLPDDIVIIPDKKEKQDSRSTEKKHDYVLHDIKAKLRIRLLLNNRPRANIPYELEIGDTKISKNTDGEGWVEAPIPADAREATLILGQDTEGETEKYLLKLGCLDPIQEVSGIKARLANLGFYFGEINNTLDDAAKAAITQFQKDRKLEQTGKVDTATKSALKKAYGS